MTAKWGKCAILAIGLALIGGCRSTQPELKPAKMAEQFVDPPAGRYDSPEYPRQSFDRPYDPSYRAFEAKNPIMPTRGMSPNGTMGR